jgi:hypothetical protein
MLPLPFTQGWPAEQGNAMQRDNLDASHHTVLAFDVEGFSRLRDLDQRDLRGDLQRIVDDACLAAGIDRARWIRQDQGDGEVALLPADVPKARVLADLVAHIGFTLRRFNGARRSDRRLRLRVAAHCGDVLVGSTGFSGQAVITACRLLDADELRAALANAPDADLAVAVSRRMYEDVVAQEPRGLDPRAWTEVHVHVKSFADAIWLHVPGTAADGAPRPGGGSEPGDGGDQEPGEDDHPAGTDQREGAPGGDWSRRTVQVVRTSGQQSPAAGHDANVTYYH